MRTNIGFKGRDFLTKAEWKTFIKRRAVRYIGKKKTEVCQICQKPPTRIIHLKIHTEFLSEGE